MPVIHCLLYTGPALPHHDFNHFFNWVYLYCYNILLKLFICQYTLKTLCPLFFTLLYLSI